MPTASVKSDSTGSSESSDPLRKLFLSVEKKIRNLEKRKNKLEFYKAEIVEGKELNEDQQKAVDAFDAVIASLELCRDFAKQIENVIEEYAKLGKVQQKKHQEEKAQYELEKIKQVLKIQDVLRRITLPEIRADFLSGTNGAIQVKDEQLKQLDEISTLVTPPIDSKREKSSAGFKVQISTAAENMMYFLDGRNKPAATGTTYREMKTLANQIANCSYPKVAREVSLTDTPQSPESETQTTQKSKKTKANKTKNQIPNGTAATGELPAKVKAKANSRVATSTAKVSPKTSTTTVTSPITTVQPPLASSIVIADPNLDCLPTSPLKSSLPDTTLSSVDKSKRREIHSAPEGPPPGIATPSVMQENATSNLIASIHPQIRTGVGATTNSTSLGQNNTFFNATQNLPTPQTSSRVSIDINDLVTGSFNFLQESQVVGPDSSSQAAVYVDPAVVSFCSMKPENLVQFNEQKQIKQLSTTQAVPPVLSSSVASVVTSHQQQQQHPQQQQQQQQKQQQPPQPQEQSLGHIPSETFINQAFASSSNSTGGFSQVVSSFSSSSGIGDVGGTNSIQTPSIPIPVKEEKKTYVEPSTFAIPVKEEKKPYIEPSTSWAAQEDTDGWGRLDNSPTPVNGSDGGWGMETSTWGEPCEIKSQHGTLQDMVDDKRTSGYRGGMNRGRGSGGSRGPSSGGGGGGFRGGRGNYNSYQGSGRGNSFGGNGFVSRGGGRGPSSNGSGGYRGRGNFSRGGRGGEGNSRGGGLRRGSYQGNPSQQRNQY